MFQHERIIRYVMGELSEAEQLHTEEQYFADAEFLGEVQAVCGELIDAYLTGRMSTRDRERFEKRLHAIPFLQAQVETSRVLLHRATAPTTPQPALLPRVVEVGWRTRLNAFLPRLVMVGAACSLLLGGAWYWWRITSSVNPNRTPEQIIAQATATPTPTPTIAPSVSATPVITATPAKPTVQPLSPPMIASILLSAEVTRGDAQLARLAIPAANGVVRLQLELPSDERRSYQVVLQTVTGQPLCTWRKAVIVHRQAVSVVELQVPAHLLPRGQYFVTLTSGTSSAYKFPFSVEPQ